MLDQVALESGDPKASIGQHLLIVANQIAALIEYSGKEEEKEREIEKEQNKTHSMLSGVPVSTQGLSGIPPLSVKGTRT